ncbi:uncharacterized protein [Misgurnus anguillicaudatus]|uniref:uncharacterized protein n=1 Tax=Misgurnus anguillicaudatus TaxID=75329 RepID=UPI003CCFD530
MASPAKIPKKGEDAVEGFIYNVSPRRQSRNISPYFTAVIQSARTEYHRVVVFSMEKQAIFSQAEKNGNAVRLRNVRRSISFSDPDGFDVLCSRMTSVEVTSLSFMRSVPVSCKAMTIAEVKALGPKQKVGEVHGKIRVHGCVNKVVSVNGMDCELKEVWICDRTGKIKVTLWDRFVNSAEVGNSYNFRNLCTRERDGCICLCTGPSSTIDQIADLEVEEGIAVIIQRKCSSCQYKQREFVEKSTIHRCDAAR